MLELIASWSLYCALNEMGIATENINVESPIFQGVVKDIQSGTLTPEEGANIVLDMLGKPNYGNRRGDKRYIKEKQG